MIIKDKNISYKTDKHIRISKKKKILRFIAKVIFIFFVLVIGILSGVKFKETRIISGLSTIKEDLLYFFGGEVFTDIKNYYKAYKAEPEVFNIDIKQVDYDRLAYNRSIALQRGFLLTDCRDEVPASITWRGKKYKVNLRLKGDLPDHWKDENKWSFRITVDGNNAIMGMKNFSIQAPETRGYLNEWMYHKFLRYNGLIALRYDFVNVKINGKDIGIYALEEFFEKRLIENNERREGPVFRFDESLYMPLLMVKNPEHTDMPAFYKEGFSVAQIDAFQTNRIMADSNYYKRFCTAKNMMESFRIKKLKTSEVFDIPKLALFFAVNDLFGEWGYGEHHPLEYRNIRFYFNPFNGKIEPIGFDNGYIWYTSQYGLQVENPEDYEWIDLFYSDPVFLDAYIKALNIVSEKTYLDKFFSSIDNEMNEKLAVLYMDSPKYRFDGKSILYENQNYIRTVLNYPAVINAHFDSFNGNKITLLVGNRQWMPMVITGLNFKDSVNFKPVEEIVLPSKKAHKLVEYQKVSFVVPANIKWTPENLNQLNIKCKSQSLGLDYSSKVMPWKLNDWMETEPSFVLKPSALKDYDFLAVDEAAKSIMLKPGKHVLRKNLVIPHGYTVVAFGGTSIDMQNKANIVSFSPVKFIGSEEAPIVFYSSDSTAQAFTVLSPGGDCYLEHVIFDNLSNPNDEYWVLTGSTNFYECTARVRYCSFLNNRGGDDNLNFVRSKMWVDHCNFIGTKADAFDGDFVNAVITNCYFKNTGNDALDFSGSILNINNLVIENPGDKGISLGEGSYANANNVKITGGEIAVAAKDLAQLRINKMTIYGSRLGFTVYQKKPEFGKGYVLVEDLVSDKVAKLHLVEEGSYLVINGAQIKPDMADVKEILYGVEYGKASR